VGGGGAPPLPLLKRRGLSREGRGNQPPDTGAGGAFGVCLGGKEVGGKTDCVSVRGFNARQMQDQRK